MTFARRLPIGGVQGFFAPPAVADIRVTDLMSSWWCTPKAVEMGGRVYVSSVKSTGANRVISVDLSDPSDIDTFTLMTNESDDHNAAALLIPTDKPPLVFYARHNQDTLLRYRKGTVIGDITSLGAQQTISLAGQTTYAQLWRRPGTDEVHVWTRERVSGAPRYWRNAYSTDYASTWSTPRRVFDFGGSQQGYIGTVPIAADPDRLRVALTGHPTSSTFHDIYYCEVDMDSGDVTLRDGTVMGNIKSGTSLPISVSTLDKVVDTDTAGGHNARLFDIGDGPAPEVFYGDWTSDANMIYYRSTWDGAAWAITSVVAAGVTFGYFANIHYNGGIMVPRDSPGDVCYLSRESAGTWSIEKWEFSGSWSLAQVLQSGTEKVVRPQPIQDYTAGPITWHDVASYPRTTTASLDWAADLIIDG